MAQKQTKEREMLHGFATNRFYFPIDIYGPFGASGGATVKMTDSIAIDAEDANLYKGRFRHSPGTKAKRKLARPKEYQSYIDDNKELGEDYADLGLRRAKIQTAATKALPGA